MHRTSSRRRTTTVRHVALASLIALLGLTATACQDDGDGGSGEPTVIQVEINGGEATVDGGDPGKRVEVGAGDPVDLEVTADAPGELHLHTDPEQTLTYDEGTKTFPLTITRPGVVEVESHDPALLIVQLEVR